MVLSEGVTVLRAGHDGETVRSHLSQIATHLSKLLLQLRIIQEVPGALHEGHGLLDPHSPVPVNSQGQEEVEPNEEDLVLDTLYRVHELEVPFSFQRFHVCDGFAFLS